MEEEASLPSDTDPWIIRFSQGAVGKKIPLTLIPPCMPPLHSSLAFPFPTDFCRWDPGREEYGELPFAPFLPWPPFSEAGPNMSDIFFRGKRHGEARKTVNIRH